MTTRPTALALASLLSLTACAAQSQTPATVQTTITAAISTPNPCTGLAIAEVYAKGGEVIVLSQVLPPPPDRMCAAVIAEATDSVNVAIPAQANIRHLVLGKSWCWENPGADAGYAYPASRREAQAMLEGYERIFQRPDLPPMLEPLDRSNCE